MIWKWKSWDNENILLEVLPLRRRIKTRGGEGGGGKEVLE